MDNEIVYRKGEREGEKSRCIFETAEQKELRFEEQVRDYGERNAREKVRVRN